MKTVALRQVHTGDFSQSCIFCPLRQILGIETQPQITTVLAGPALAQPADGPLNLVCEGEGAKPASETRSVREWDKKAEKFVYRTETSQVARRFPTEVSVRIDDGEGRVHVQVPGGGCGADTVKDLVSAAIEESAPEVAGVVFDAVPAGPTLLQIGVRPAERVTS